MKRLNAAFLTLLVMASVVAPAAAQTGPGRMGDSGVQNGSMMQCGMMGGPMMIVGWLFALLIFVLLVLAILSLVKYLRSARR
ncbi:hypothetical protein [Salinisphaera hydrothermalis]|uniref:hypothetical protein n=1 Tax=Salinisphaera hydrothermalis TaxID=563188 RepID=UPI0033401E30